MIVETRYQTKTSSKNAPKFSHSVVNHLYEVVVVIMLIAYFRRSLWSLFWTSTRHGLRRQKNVSYEFGLYWIELPFLYYRRFSNYWEFHFSTFHDDLIAYLCCRLNGLQQIMSQNIHCGQVPPIMFIFGLSKTFQYPPFSTEASVLFTNILTVLLILLVPFLNQFKITALLDRSFKILKVIHICIWYSTLCCLFDLNFCN